MGKRILIADDEPSIVISLEFLMQRGGHEVRTASNGDEAVTTAREFRPDLLLLDVMMPKRNGYEVCRALRSDPTYQRLKIILLTAKGREQEVAKGLGIGADAYVTKPFATRELVRIVNRLLQSDL